TRAKRDLPWDIVGGGPGKTGRKRMAESGRTPPADEITPEALYRRRREFLKDSLLFAATSLGVGGGLLSLVKGRRSDQPASEPADAARLDFATGSPYDTTEAKTPYGD